LELRSLSGNLIPLVVVFLLLKNAFLLRKLWIGSRISSWKSISLCDMY